MTGHMTLFFSKQHDAPSIWMLVDLSNMYQIMVQFIFFISALASSPLLDAKLSHSVCLCDWV